MNTALSKGVKAVINDINTPESINVTLYWITQTIHSSIRIYNENSKHALIFTEKDFVKVPVAFAKFPKELPTPPRSYIEKGLNIQRRTEMTDGGHFAAMEQPGLLAKDIRDFFWGLFQVIILMLFSTQSYNL